MPQDAFVYFSDEQAITATAASTNTVDLKSPGTPAGWSQAVDRGELANGQAIPLFIRVMETFTNLTSLRIDVENDDNESFTSPGIVGSTGLLSLAQLVVGARLHPALHLGAPERYLRMKYTVAGVAPDAGKISAYIDSAQ